MNARAKAALLIGCLLVGFSLAAGISFRTYCNARFGFCLEYPSSLVMQPAPENDDGRRFRSKDARVEMRAYAGYNALEISFERAYREAQSNRHITYKLFKGDFFVVSGTERGKVVYQKTFLRAGVFTTMLIYYPPDLKAQYDPIVSRVSRSLKPGP